MPSFFSRFLQGGSDTKKPLESIWTRLQRHHKRMSGYEEPEEEATLEEQVVPAPLQHADDITDDLHEETTDPFAAPGFDTDEIINSDFERKGPYRVIDMD